jgi:hypothetical protein
MISTQLIVKNTNIPIFDGSQESFSRLVASIPNVRRLLSCVDDILIAGSILPVDEVEAKKALPQHFTLDKQGEILEYVECRVEHNKNERWIKLTQPEMIKS